MAQNGRNILVYRSGALIAGTRSNEIQTECDMMEVNNPSSGQWRQFMAGRKSWTITTGYLLAAVANLADLLTVGTSYELRFRDRSGSKIIGGTAILKTVKITSNIDSLVQGSFTFQGNGVLEVKQS